MEYPYFKGLEADRYSFYRVPKALVKADLFQKMSGDAKLLYQFQKIHAIQSVPLHPQRKGYSETGQYHHRQYKGGWREVRRGFLGQG